MGALIVEAGQEIRDGSGRLIGTVTRNIERGKPMLPEHFLLADGTHPKVGDLVHPAIFDFIARRRGQA